MYPLRSADMPAGTTVRLLGDFQEVSGGTIGTTVECMGSVYAVYVAWNGSNRRDFVACRYLEIVTVAAPVAAEFSPLTLSVDGDTVTVSGARKGCSAHESVLPRPWVWSRTAGAFVLPRSLKPSTRSYRVSQLLESAVRAGVPVTVEDAGARQGEADRPWREVTDGRSAQHA